MVMAADTVGCSDDALTLIESAFGSAFVLWTRSAEGWRDRSVLARVGLPADPGEVLQMLVRSGRHWGVFAQDTGYTVAVRIPADEPTFAVGCVVAPSSRWLEPLARVLADDLEQRAACRQHLLAIDSLAEQVSETFEEVTLLRSFSSYLECCEVERPLRDVAEALLPRLRSVLRAEAVALVPNPSAAAEDAHDLEEIVWTGYRPIRDDECLSLSERLAPCGTRQPAVRNAAAGVALHSSGEVRACLVYPVIRDDLTVGWLVALNKLRPDSSSIPWEGELGHDEFGTVEAGLLGAVAMLLATHARNGRMYRERERLLTDMTRSLINTLDAKDSYTCGHSDRVASIARRLAQQIGLDRAECERIYLTGLLHDIGKIGVPDEVLLKPGRLTEEEFALIKRHPVIGYEILLPLRPLSYTLPGVLHHHESLDGRGYPHGLSGDAIPLPARILAVADAYDAMTSCRPYRQAMPSEKAESILREGAGRQWDPRIVEAFFAALDDIRTIARDQAPLMNVLSTAAAE